jgi:hypothetical protein
MTKPGGLMLMRFHYFMSAGTVIIGIACGVDSDLRTTRHKDKTIEISCNKLRYLNGLQLRSDCDNNLSGAHFSRL